MRTVIKNLKKYKFVYSNKQIIIKDKATEQSVVLDKVAFFSLIRFIIRITDVMRIDDINNLKEKIKNKKTKVRFIK